jgi:glycine/D-amino acid oxidase-like deaminating enzyme
MNKSNSQMVSSIWADPIRSHDSIPSHADVVIIGGGIIGISTAYYLSRKGISVVLCEKGHIAGEQSSRNWGWIRQQGRDRRELPLMIESINLWNGLEHEIGNNIGFHQGGCIFSANNEKQFEGYRQWLDVAKQYGLDTHLVQGKELDSLVSTSIKWLGGLYTPSDCRAEPHKAVPAIAKAASQHGVKVLTGCAVRGIDQANRHVTGVVTEYGTIKTSSVLCASGAWTSMFCGTLGVKIPQLKVRCTVARTSPCDLVLKGNLFDDRIALRKRADGGYTVAHAFIVDHSITPSTLSNLVKFLPALLQDPTTVRLSLGADFFRELITPKKWDLDSVSPFERNRILNPPPNAKRLASIRRNFTTCFPGNENVRLLESWAGMIESTPDMIPIIDEIEAIRGLYIATGFSGHGFGIGLGAGKAISLLISDGIVSDTISPFKLKRFNDGSKLYIESISGA